MYSFDSIKKGIRDFAEDIKDIISGMDSGRIKYDCEKYNELSEMFDAVREIFKSMRYGSELSYDEMELAYDIVAGDYDDLLAY